jgi:hypothetical protein
VYAVAVFTQGPGQVIYFRLVAGCQYDFGAQGHKVFNNCPANSFCAPGY